MKQYDLAVIGSGVGLTLIDAALQQGLSCALVENAKFGGTCLTRGCIPSKILVHPADLIRDAERADRVGLHFSGHQLDWPAISKRMWRQIDQSKGIEKSLDGAHGLDTYKGTGEFTGPHTMRVAYAEGSYSEDFSARRFIVAAGGRPSIPPISGLEDLGYLDTEKFFGEGFPKKPWDSLVIIGGGAIGAEFAHIFSAYGCKVTVVEMLPRLVPTEEEAVSGMLESNFRQSGIDVYTGHKALSVRAESGKKILKIQNTQTMEEKDIPCEEILLAAGIRPNSDLLRADLAGIEMDDRGWIKTNEYLETSQPHIWALGDINGKYQFRHKANYEADVLLNNLFYSDGPKQKAEYDAVPWAIFTHPQIAHVGLTQTQAAKQHSRLMVGVKHYSSVAKGFAMGYEEGDRDDGFVKLVAGEDMKILGVHIIGPEAAVLIQAFVYLMNTGYRCQKSVPHGYDTNLQSTLTCPGGSFEAIGRAMVIHPSLSEVAGWAVGNLDWAEVSDEVQQD